MTQLEIILLTILGLWQLFYMIGIFSFVKQTTKPKGFFETFIMILLYITPISFGILAINEHFRNKRKLKKESA